MPQIPQYFSTGEISTESPNALAPRWLADDISAPNRILSATLEQMKQDFEAIQAERQETQDMWALANMTNALTDQTIEWSSTFEEKLKKGMDEEGNPIDYRNELIAYDIKYDEFDDLVRTNPNLNDRVKARMLIKSQTERKKDLIAAHNTVLKYQMRDDQETFLDNLNQFIVKKDVGEAIGLIDGALVAGTITMPQAKQYKEEAAKNITLSQLEDLKRQPGNTLKGVYKHVSESKEDYLTIEDNSGKIVYRMDDSVIDSFLSQTRAEINFEDHKKNEAKEYQKEVQESNYRSELVKFWTGEMNPTETLSLIAQGQIDEGKGNQLLKDFETKVNKNKKEKTDEQKKELEDISFLNYSVLLPKVRKAAETGRKTDIDSLQETINEEVKKDELNGSHAKQLTDFLYPKDKDQKEKNPINDPRIKDKLDKLEMLRKAGVKFAKSDSEIDQAIGFTKKHDEFIDWARRHPEATTQQINEYYEEFLKGKRKEVSVGILERLFGGGTKTEKPGASQAAIPKDQVAPEVVKKDWIERAKAVNPNVSEKALSDYYDQQKVNK